jgi:hypothetical protein
MQKQMLKNQSLDTKVECGHCVSAWGTLPPSVKRQTTVLKIEK